MPRIKNLEEQLLEWFREYGSHVILHRAVPAIEDGLKPSQRRVMHSLWELEDGKYNKVANAAGNTLKYHPHGDQSVFETMVGIGQKGYLIDPQGNWGNTLTGDGAAAARYIEARLTPLAKENLFNRKTTQWMPTYDGKNQEPVTLPTKFPLLLCQGTEGIAVSLACKILPHNLAECCQAAMQHLTGEDFELLPDFPQGGLADVSAYKDGTPGGKVKVRARIEKGKNSLIVTEIPYGTTTINVRDSIVKAEEKGSIKIKRVTDLTAEKAHLVVEYPPGTDLGKAEEALYAFTECEVSHTVCGVVIEKGKPRFLGTKELLVDSAERTKKLIGLELEIALAELDAQWQKLSLEKIFIETKAYQALESATTPEAGREAIRKVMAPALPRLRRQPTEEEIGALTEIRIRRISAYDCPEAEKEIEAVEKKEREARKKLKNLTETTILHFGSLLTKYGDRKRRTEIVAEPFEKIETSEVALTTQKIYWDVPGGFIGTSLRKDSLLPFEVNPMTDIVGIAASGVMKICRPGQKTFYGENLLDARPVEKEHQPVYNMVYWDEDAGKVYAKRFRLDTGFTRERAYNLGGDNPMNHVYFLSVTRENEKGPKVTLFLDKEANARKKELQLDFETLGIKGRGSAGYTITHHRLEDAVETKPR
jgi:topoisomerase-4 subunit A